VAAERPSFSPPSTLAVPTIAKSHAPIAWRDCGQAIQKQDKHVYRTRHVERVPLESNPWRGQGPTTNIKRVCEATAPRSSGECSPTRHNAYPDLRRPRRQHSLAKAQVRISWEKQRPRGRAMS
jgi:hypothetical protein